MNKSTLTATRSVLGMIALLGMLYAFRVEWGEPLDIFVHHDVERYFEDCTYLEAGVPPGTQSPFNASEIGEAVVTSFQRKGTVVSATVTLSPRFNPVLVTPPNKFLRERVTLHLKRGGFTDYFRWHLEEKPGLIILTRDFYPSTLEGLPR